MPRRSRLVGVSIALLAGLMLAGQARVNGQLGADLGDGVLAALVSFGVGLVLLAVLTAVLPAARRGLRGVATALRGYRLGERPTGGLRPWHCLGGVCGALLVACQGLTVGVLGVAVFTVAVIAGQAGSSLVVDRLGLGPGGPRPVTAPRVVGAVLAVAAVVLSVAGRFGTPHALVLAVLPVLAGLAVAWQQAVTGLVNATASAASPPGSRGIAAGAVPAATINFATGTVALLAAVAVDLAVRGAPSPLPSQPLLYLGGVLGVVFITAAAAVVRLTGVLVLALASVAGQLLGALLLDVLTPAPGEHLTAAAAAGAALTLVAVAVTALPGRGRRGTGMLRR